MKILSPKHLIPLLIVGYVTVAATLYLSQNSQVFHPPLGHVETPEQWGWPYETVPLISGGHTLINWWIPGDPEGVVILFFHHGFSF